MPLFTRHATFAGRGFVRGRVFRVGSYPALAICADGSRVDGELYDIEPAAWNRVVTALDAYEGCSVDDPEPHAYRREVIDVEDQSGRIVRAWAYLLTALRR